MALAKTSKMRQTEDRLGKPLEVIIPETYNRIGNIDLTAQELKIPTDTLRNWMMRLRLEFRLVVSNTEDN